MTEQQNEILRLFNALPSAEAQHGILDVIHDALYHQSYLQVIGNRVIRERDEQIAKLTRERDRLRDELDTARSEAAATKATRYTARDYFESLTPEERQAFRTEAHESMQYKAQRAELKRLREELRTAYRNISDLGARLEREKRGNGAAEPSGGTGARRSLLQRILGD